MTKGWNGELEDSFPFSSDILNPSSNIQGGGSSSIFKSGKALAEDLKVYDAYVERVKEAQEVQGWAMGGGGGNGPTAEYYEKWLGLASGRRRGDTL